jgi:hypothetical protein
MCKANVVATVKKNAPAWLTDRLGLAEYCCEYLPQSLAVAAENGLTNLRFST